MAGPDLTGDQGLAEHVGQRQPQELHVVRAQQPAGLLSDPLVRPAVVHQAHTLRAARRARGVDQGGELFPLDGPNRLLDRVRMLIQVRRTPLLQLGEGEHLQPLHPREVRPGIEEDRVAEPWQAFDGGGDLVQLDRVLDEDRPAAGVGENVDSLLSMGAGVDGGGGGARAHRAQIGQDPLHPGGGGDRHPLLGPHPQGQQPGRDRMDAFGGLRPGQRVPPLGTGSAAGGRHGIAVGFPAGRGFDP